MSLTRLGNIKPGRLGIFAGSLTTQPATVQREVVAEMEKLGYGTLWFGESLGREVFAQGAIFLSATSRLVIASGIANIWARDPMAMAAGGRALAEAWPDRFILGLGVSHAPMVTSRGHDYARPFSAMRDYLDRIGEAPWRGPEAPLPPIVLAALGPRMVTLAAERTAGAYPYFTTSDHIRQVRQQLGPEPFLVADLPVVLAGGRAEARAIGDGHTSLYLRTENYRNNLLRLGWKPEELQPPGSDAIFDAVVAWGDTATVQERINALFAAGADQVALNLATRDRSVPYLPELRALASLKSAVGR
ncbi:MAG TPA: TIGR03620 family F420-dependent LLM class oxidoreductase [Candidatus Dormibacteraeota bacterium]|nr:TIGR03620 family F420-dependent LLM class oxidoreductase [Candidatus Dormibacteraeota bacterium]